MKSIFSFSLVLAFAFTTFLPFTSAQIEREGTEQKGVQVTKMIKQRVVDKEVEKCIENGNEEENCENRLKSAKKNLAKYKKENRKNFVMMIVNSKKECTAEYEDKAEIRECFRGKVKESFKERLKKARLYKKDCKAELGEDALTKEVLACAEEKRASEGKVDSYDSCEENGGDIMESYPRQCSWEGETYEEELTQEEIDNYGAI